MSRLLGFKSVVGFWPVEKRKRRFENEWMDVRPVEVRGGWLKCERLDVDGTWLTRGLVAGCAEIGEMRGCVLLVRVDTRDGLLLLVRGH